MPRNAANAADALRVARGPQLDSVAAQLIRSDAAFVRIEQNDRAPA